MFSQSVSTQSMAHPEPLSVHFLRVSWIHGKAWFSAPRISPFCRRASCLWQITRSVYSSAPSRLVSWAEPWRQAGTLHHRGLKVVRAYPWFGGAHLPWRLLDLHPVDAPQVYPSACLARSCRWPMGSAWRSLISVLHKQTSPGFPPSIPSWISGLWYCLVETGGHHLWRACSLTLRTSHQSGGGRMLLWGLCC